MAKFPKKFRLETLMTIRRNILNEKQGELAKAYEAERFLEDKRTETGTEITAVLGMAKEMMRSGGIDIQFLLGTRRREAYLMSVIQDIDSKLVAVRKEIEVRRQAVIEANKEVKILEKIKEKQQERRAVHLQKLDMKQMDEIAETRAARMGERFQTEK